MIPGTKIFFIKDETTRSAIISFENGVLSLVGGYPIVTDNTPVYSQKSMMMPGPETLILTISRINSFNLSIYEFCSLSCASCPVSNVIGTCTSCNPNFVPGPNSTCYCPSNYFLNATY